MSSLAIGRRNHPFCGLMSWLPHHSKSAPSAGWTALRLSIIHLTLVASDLISDKEHERGHSRLYLARAATRARAPAPHRMLCCANLHALSLL